MDAELQLQADLETVELDWVVRGLRTWVDGHDGRSSTTGKARGVPNWRGVGAVMVSVSGREGYWKHRTGGPAVVPDGIVIAITVLELGRDAIG